MRIIAYHGSPQPLESFRSPSVPRYAPGNIEGIYFATRMEEAVEYGRHVHECRISLASPFVGNPRDLLERHLGIKRPSFGDAPEMFRAYAEKVNGQTMKAHLLALGHDGVLIPASAHYGCDEVIVFSESQIELLQIHQIDLEEEAGRDDYGLDAPGMR